MTQRSVFLFVMSITVGYHSFASSLTSPIFNFAPYFFRTPSPWYYGILLVATQGFGREVLNIAATNLPELL